MTKNRWLKIFYLESNFLWKSNAFSTYARLLVQLIFLPKIGVEVKMKTTISLHLKRVILKKGNLQKMNDCQTSGLLREWYTERVDA